MSKPEHSRKKKRAQRQTANRTNDIALMDAEKATADKQTESSANSDKDPERVQKASGWWDRLRIWLEAEKSFTDWCIAVFTFVLAAAAIYQFVIMGGQLETMRTDQRAWLEVEAIPDSPQGEIASIRFTPGQSVVYPIRVMNIGKTPAQHVEVKAFMDIIETNQEPPLDRIDNAMPGSPYPFTYMEVGIIFPNADSKLQCVRVRKGGAPQLATDGEVNGIKNARSRLAIYGIVTYDDAFKRPHWTKFCREIPIGYSGTRRCASYNSAD